MPLGWSLGKGSRGGPSEPKQDLGESTIDGVEYLGTRTVFGSDPADRMTLDVWIAKNLGLMGLVEASGSGRDRRGLHGPDFRRVVTFRRC